MNSFHLPHSFYEPSVDIDPTDFGYVNKEEVPDLTHVSEVFKGLLKAVYESGNLDELENCLDELGDCLDIELPHSVPVLKSPNMHSKKKGEKR